MPAFSLDMAHHTPTIYSDDIRSPFQDIGMGDWSDDDLAAFFENKRVIDIGSGFEGMARRLFTIFKDSPAAPEVVNLNPQFTDWRMKDIREDGLTKSVKMSKKSDIEAGMCIAMELGGEDYDGYMAQRIAVAGIVQQLEFDDDYFDIQISTWAFPNVLYDCGGTFSYGVAGYQEVLRTQKSGGVALLAPVRDHQKTSVEAQLNATGVPYIHTFLPASCEGDVLRLQAV